MADLQPSTPSVVDRTRPFDAGAPIVGAYFLGGQAVFVLGEEALVFAGADGAARRVVVHGGGILSAISDGTQIVTGGDDGKLAVTDIKGETRVLATDERRRWIDRVAIGPDGVIAWSVGKTVSVQTGKGEVRTLDVPSSVGGLAFAPKGLRLAVSHYNGVTLWFPNAKAAPEHLSWKGSHHEVGFSPDGKFLLTSMQEPTLHGWRLVDGKDMRMSGYSSRVRSFGWTAGGRFLATSGADQLILWPFAGKDGPMGKTPLQLAAFGVRAEVVACHPKQDVVAVGYADGLVLLVRIEDGAEILAKKPNKVPVTALAWDEAGVELAWGGEDGKAGLINLA